MSGTECSRQLKLFKVGLQQVTAKFDGGQVVSDAGLLPMAQLDHELGILAEAARRLPDPRSQVFVTHSAEDLLRQQVFQILAGYPDGNDAQQLRDDPLFKTIVGVDPRRADRPLASGSTLNRFQHAYTRREADKPLEERDVLPEVRRAQIERIRGLNEFLVDVFVRTRPAPPAEIIIDLDPTDDPTHGQQQLTFWHGYYDQNQYFPLLIFEGTTGMPLGAWLRPGTVHAGCGAVEILQHIVERLRAHWPEVKISVRGDCGLASPEMYEFCEAEGFEYAFGYAVNEVLKRRHTAAELGDHACWLWWMTGRESFQLFQAWDDYQAESWSCPRRVVVKTEITRTGGPNVRYVVTNKTGHAADVYHGFYTQRGDVPERPIGELKRGLAMDRLSSPRFLANAQKLMTHMVAYLLYALFREANARTPEVATMEINTARSRLFKVGAVVKATHRRIWFHVASHWPGRDLWIAASGAVRQFIDRLRIAWNEQQLFVRSPLGNELLHFAPRTPK